MMRLLADENFPSPAIKALADNGHDIISVASQAPSMSDADIFVWAIRDERVILTFDKDFGEISRQTAASRQCGVILFRGPMPPFASIGAHMVKVINMRSDWVGHFSVVQGDRIRQSPMTVG